MDFENSIAELAAYIQSRQFDAVINRIDGVKAHSVSWSVQPSKEFLPFKIMLSGLRPAPLVKEPVNKANAFEYNFNEQGKLFLINSYGQKGNIEWKEYVDLENNISVSVDKYYDFLYCSKLIVDDSDDVIASVYIDDEVKIYYSYVYEGGVINSINVRSSQNEYIETTLFVERNGLEVVNIYYFFNEKKMYLIK
ncbi:hypothetical protein [Vibrio metschnikovii]|uniref:hypothetical protein n=1 Tax=Vibrio metschnikovii TaxID=28172 RepID=UPI002FC71391